MRDGDIGYSLTQTTFWSCELGRCWLPVKSLLQLYYGLLLLIGKLQRNAPKFYYCVLKQRKGVAQKTFESLSSPSSKPIPKNKRRPFTPKSLKDNMRTWFEPTIEDLRCGTCAAGKAPSDDQLSCQNCTAGGVPWVVFGIESGWPTWRVVTRRAFFLGDEHESRPKESGNLLAQPLTSCWSWVSWFFPRSQSSPHLQVVMPRRRPSGARNVLQVKSLMSSAAWSVFAFLKGTTH